MKKLLFLGLLGLIFSLSIANPGMAEDEFTEISTNLPGVYYSSVAWGDYDNDGDLDILLTGGNVSGLISEIYRNDGNGIFTDIDADLAGVYMGSVAWSDYDNDGDLDILLTGGDGTGSANISKIYRNDPGANGSRVFTDIQAGLTGVYISNVAWGDYDNDGDLDILLTGTVVANTTEISKIYRNDPGPNGSRVFTDIQAGLAGVVSGSVAWGDYDNDGDLDILLTGFPDSGCGATTISKIYRNDPGPNGSRVFTDIQAGLTGIVAGDVDWGDYDNDGDLDILLTGWINNLEVSKIYRNDPGPNGSRVFTDIQAGLAGVDFSSVAWGDYDNDGDLDILLTGNTEGGVDISKIYRNDPGPNGSRVFTDIQAGLAVVECGSVAWGDYDNDGDLDILLTGGSSGGISKIYRNNALSPNTLPNAPSNPQANVSSSNVTLSWQKATDSQTPQDGLYYSIFIGTSPNEVQIESPMAEVPGGLRRIAAIGSQNENTSWTINNLADGTYYWGVQAIDTAFAGSPFALGTFTISDTYTISGTVTLDGIGFPGVELYEEGTNNVLATTQDPSGYYEIPDLPDGWTKTVTPYKDSYTFNPTNRPYNNLSGSLENQDYAATLNTYTISGTVTLNGVGLEGVDLKDSQQNLLAVTDSAGYYVFTREHGWTEIVTPHFNPEKYIFDPVNRSYNLTANQENQDYAATLKTFTISGDITGLQPNNSYPVEVTATGANGSGDLPAVLGTSGSYTFTDVPYGWEGELTATSVAYDFTPLSRTIPPVIDDVTNQNFTAILKTFTISGTVLDNNSDVLPDWAQAKVNGVDVDPITGMYSFTVDYNGSITLIPTATGYDIDPTTKTFANITSHQTQNFVGTIQTFTVSGTVLDNNSDVLPDWAQAKVNGVAVDPITGMYSFTVDYNGSITLIPTATGYDIDPTTKTFANITSNETQDFVGTLQTFTIEGEVSGLSVPDSITITATGTGSYVGDNFPATVDANGSYSTGQIVPYNWTGNLITTSAAYNITADQPVFTGGPVTDHVTQDYTAALKTFTISGNISGILSPSNPYPITITAAHSNVPTYEVYGPFSIIAATDGSYLIPDVPYGWEGKLSAYSEAYNFTPPEIPVTSVTDDLPDQDFTAAIKRFTISGNISGILSPSNPYPITITAAHSNVPTYEVYGPFSIIAATDGSYLIPDVPYGWEGKLSAYSEAYNFTPPEIPVTSVTDDLPDQDFKATLKEYTISGDISGTVPGENYPITLTAECTNNPQYSYVSVDDIDASDGDYDFTLPHGWEGKLIAQSPAYELKEDPEGEFTSPVTEHQEQNYVATLKTCTVSGDILGLIFTSVNPPHRITIRAECINTQAPWYKTIEADATDGSYSMTLYYGWKGILVPESTFYNLTEHPMITFNSPVFSPQEQDYIVISDMFTISGTVYNRLSPDIIKPMAGVSIIDMETQEVLAVTDIHGEYSFDKASGWGAKVEPVKDPYTFIPDMRGYEDLNEDKPGEDYRAYD